MHDGGARVHCKASKCMHSYGCIMLTVRTCNVQNEKRQLETAMVVEGRLGGSKDSLPVRADSSRSADVGSEVDSEVDSADEGHGQVSAVSA